MIKQDHMGGNLRFRLLTIGGVLGVAVIMAALLVLTKDPSVKAERRERAIRVQVIRAAPADVNVNIHGFGEVRARDIVNVAPEVAGRIVEVHPRLDVGEVIPAGEVLFVIDPRDYESRLTDATATVEQLKSSLERMRKQSSIDGERLKTYQRTSEVSNSEFMRVKSLYEQDQVGTQSNVDQTEMAYNNAKDATARLQQAVDLYPIQIREMEASLDAAMARKDMAAVNFERTQVKAPFNARVKAVNVEAGQYIAPGAPILTLADDSLLEISVSLNSNDARTWLQFESEPLEGGEAWFGAVKPVPVKIYWTEGNDETEWIGELDRVEKFEEKTRTLTVAVRVSGENVMSRSGTHIPLVEGMFCRVEIPGNVAKNVYAIPVAAVGFDRDASGYRTAYLADKGEDGSFRLRSAKVKESHLDDEFVYISEGIEPGAMIVSTRLVNVLENSLLSLDDEPAGGESGADESAAAPESGS